ncbi:MAG: LysR family transcriptional regulator [Selenomonadaceae bacterium]|nr:LysR family transcriptional regulator [Selenomonadaceae bacterium]
MELRQLEYFCAVCSLENFTRAAHFLHVSQPSVTKAVQALEAELKLTLFDRSQKHICLTDAGRVFLLHAQKILQDVQTAQLAMERFQSQSGGVIRFGVPPMFESYLFPNFFMKFQAANPDIVLDLQECSDSASVNEKLDNDALDFGINFVCTPKHMEHSLKMFDDEFYLCLPPRHRFALREKISFEELRGEKFILQPPGTLQNFLTLKGAAEAGFAPEVLLSTSQLKTIKELVAGSAAVALMPKFTISDLPAFKAMPLDPPLKFTVVLVWSRFKEPSALGKRFLNFVEGLFGEVKS